MRESGSAFISQCFTIVLSSLDVVVGAVCERVDRERCVAGERDRKRQPVAAKGKRDSNTDSHVPHAHFTPQSLTKIPVPPKYCTTTIEAAPTLS